MSYWRGFSAGIALLVATTAAAADVSKVTLKIDGMTPTGCSSVRYGDPQGVGRVPDDRLRSPAAKSS